MVFLSHDYLEIAPLMPNNIMEIVTSYKKSNIRKYYGEDLERQYGIFRFMTISSYSLKW